MADTIYGMGRSDTGPFRELIDWWQTDRQTPGIDSELTGTAYPFITLTRPTGWALGLCRELIEDRRNPFIWEVNLLGYPAVAGRTTFRLVWTGPDRRRLESGPIAVDATAAEFAKAMPEGLPAARFFGGSVRLFDGSPDDRLFDLGRFWVAFERDPGFVPEIADLTSDDLRGITRRTHLRPSGQAREFFTLASVDGPIPVHPGTVGVGFAVGSRMCMLYHEPRIYQGTLATTTEATFIWSVSPFRQSILEGESGRIIVQLSVDQITTLEEPSTTSIDFEWTAGTTAAADFTGELADWIGNAVTALKDSLNPHNLEWDAAGQRLTATVSPDGPALIELEVIIPTVAEGTLEGTETASVAIRNPLAGEVGVASIRGENAIVDLQDADALTWFVTGPAEVAAEGTGTYKLTATGVLKVGTFSSIRIEQTGSLTVAQFSDWEEALRLVADARDDADVVAGVLTIEKQDEDGVIPALEFDVGFPDANAEGTFTLTITAESQSPGLTVEIDGDAGSVTTDVKIPEA